MTTNQVRLLLQRFCDDNYDDGEDGYQYERFHDYDDHCNVDIDDDDDDKKQKQVEASV